MIVKNIKITPYIRKLEAVSRRLPLIHPRRQAIDEELAKTWAGYKGEKSLDYYFTFLPKQEYLIFHDLRFKLKDSPYFFQIDVLILTPTFFLILESKNIAGTITYDPVSHQFIRTLNDKVEVFPDPIEQVKLQLAQFIEWLRQNKCSTPPIEPIVVITNPYTLIKMPPGNTEFQKMVIPSSNLLSRIGSLQNQYPDEMMSRKDIRKISRLLLKHHTPYDPDILERFNISESDLLTGVFCPNCSTLSMKKQYGKWGCQKCSFTSRNAHIADLKDFCLLIGSTITNQQAKHFLNLSSGSSAHHLLTLMGFPYTGATRDRVYYLSFDEFP